MHMWDSLYRNLKNDLHDNNRMNILLFVTFIKFNYDIENLTWNASPSASVEYNKLRHSLIC